jgi:hypothetical protein
LTARILLLASSLLLFVVGFGSPAVALQFTQDSFVYNAASPRANTKVELSKIDPAAQSFEVTASGWIEESFLPDGEFSYIRGITLGFNTVLTGYADITSVSIVDTALPPGATASGFAGPDLALLAVEFAFPPPMDPFTWSATFEVTTTELVGNYGLYQVYGDVTCIPFPDGSFDCDGGAQQNPDDVFEYSIVPEPSAGLLFAAGLAIVSQAGRRARHRPKPGEYVPSEA